MEALTLTQTIFYAVASVVMTVLGVLLAIIAFRIIFVLKSVSLLSKDIKHLYSKFAGVISKLTRIVRK
ncbi:MAG: hypothetical protein K9L98_03750 [Candidatus Pacebacteria bacterium]|nr:hypothetical protein [Candidatus Paceibacterota bacterium]MCF7863089.1 hypothetical protein [Candidatus Paceibacterota bacterium]